MLEQKKRSEQDNAQPFETQVGRALLVVNAKARQGRENFREALLQLQQQGIQLVDAHGVTNPRYIKPLVKKYLERGGIDTVIVGGGDGTVSALADLLAQYNTCLGIIPMGTANDFARNLKINPNIAEAVDVLKQGYVLPVDLGAAKDHYFLNVASIGLGVEVASNVDQSLKKLIGPLAYGAAAVQTLNEMRPVHVRLVFKDRPTEHGFETVEYRALQVAVANGRYYGGGMVAAPNVTITDSRLTVTVIENMSVMELIRLVPGMRDGTYVRHPKVHRYTTTNVYIETRRPKDVNMDGEICVTAPLEFKIMPAALNVFAPRP
ncbi:MAG TPA: lipid kinase [Chloroflexia bacterium]|nr:lipid kinase [Chloroflexia bacterium]